MSRPSNFLIQDQFAGGPPGLTPPPASDAPQPKPPEAAPMACAYCKAGIDGPVAYHPHPPRGSAPAFVHVACARTLRDRVSRAGGMLLDVLEDMPPLPMTVLADPAWVAWMHKRAAVLAAAKE